MKKIYIISLIVCLAAFSQSCADSLSVERYFNDRQSIENIFKSKDYTEEWLSQAYFQLLTYNLEIGHVRYTVSNFSDDAVFNESNEYGSFGALKDGTYDPDKYSGSWNQSYIGIRQASIMIEHVDTNQELTKDEIKDLKGQAYFIRAYFYWLLLKKYGPVPILPEKGLDYEDSYDKLSVPRSSYDECVEYIAQQMLLAADLLPAGKRGSRDAARPTRGAALSVRAKAYLYAASPLMNGEGQDVMAGFVDNNGRQLISPVKDNSKWAKAAAAALDVIKLDQYKLHVATRRETGTSAYPKTIEPPFHPVYSANDFPAGWKNIDPFESYRSLFSGDLYATDNEELIFTRGDNQVDPEFGIISMTRHQMPQSLGGYNCHGITVKQCDAYAMNDGTPFNYEKRHQEMKNDPAGMFVTSQEANDKKYPYLTEGVWKEYANREPRFYASVGYSGAIWPGASSKQEGDRNKKVWYYRGSGEGRNTGSERWQPTGIGMVKYVSPKDSYKEGYAYPKFDPAIRYADILLMYAEALNEIEGQYTVASWNGAENYIITRDQSEMKKYFSQIRIRAGVPDIGDIQPGIYGDVKEFRKALKRERQVELFAENQRYYDLRRWMDAPKEEGDPLIGLNTFISENNREYFYERIKVSFIQNVFSKKMYFWPVTHGELQRNKNLTQAPGWESYD